MKKHKINYKLIIAIVVILILLLLVLFAKGVIKINNKNTINLAENPENELISNEPNPPQLSAGMIPVKWDGTNWIITTANDKEWYDYSKGKPAYIMLNDGDYQSELIRDMTGKELAENAVGVGVPDDPSKRGTIFVWIPRFAYKDSGEIGYIKEGVQLGEDWYVPEVFIYRVSDNTKADFSLSGVWLEKDVDIDYANEITKMNQEGSIYGFISNTKAKQIGSGDRYEIQQYTKVVGDLNITEITNINRIVLQIINDNKYEPIKASITHNTVEQRLEIRVTYTANGIREILDEYGNQMALTEENGIIYTDTSNITLAKGTYKFTVIDNKGNKKELSVAPTINSLLKVAYINGTDNMDNTNTYTKTQETKTAAENTLINQLKAADSSKTYSRAITDSNKAITAITQIGRTAEDEQMYLYGKYKANSTTKYSWINDETVTISFTDYAFGLHSSISKNADTGAVTLSDWCNYAHGGRYSISSNHSDNAGVAGVPKYTSYYYWSGYNSSTGKINRTYYKRTSTTTYSRGTLNSNVIARDGTYTIGSTSKVHSDGFWYVRNSLAPKYTLQKYDQNLNLQSTYDVDTKILTTESIDISNKGNNKVKLTLNTTGTNYKTYISNDNTNWQEVTDITSGTPKELNVNGWNNLYIKIETNTSRINNIDVAFYKD